MKLFSKKATAEPVPYDDATAYQLGSVHNLSDTLHLVADKMDWADRSQPSPPVDAKLKWGTDTYGNRAMAVSIGKHVVGYLPRSANDKLTALLGNGEGRGSVQFTANRSLLLARCCVAA